MAVQGGCLIGERGTTAAKQKRGSAASCRWCVPLSPPRTRNAPTMADRRASDCLDLDRGGRATGERRPAWR